MKLVPFKDILDTDEFWRGTRFRIYGIGLNVKDKIHDYYEYILAENPSDNIIFY